MACCKDNTFQRYKLERYFDFLDFDGNGKVESKDLVLWAEKGVDNFAESGKPLTDENQAKLAKQCRLIFNIMTLFGFVGKSKESFASYFVFQSKLPGFRLIFRLLVKPIFEAADVNGDGKVSWEEFYFLILKPVGISEEDAKIAFKIIDTNGDGSISLDEYATAIVSYFADTEVNQYSLYYGPLEKVPENYGDSVDAMVKSVQDQFGVKHEQELGDANSM